MVESWISTPIGDDNANQYYLTFRFWDGIDKPDYWRFCTIKKEERDLNSGRFKNFDGWVDYHDANLRWCLVPYDKTAEIMEWIFDNVKGNWAMGIAKMSSDGMRMNFKFEDDEAMAFKLTFSYLHCE